MNHVRKLSIRDRSLDAESKHKQHVNDAPSLASSSHLLIVHLDAMWKIKSWEAKDESEKKVLEFETENHDFNFKIPHDKLVKKKIQLEEEMA